MTTHITAQTAQNEPPFRSHLSARIDQEIAILDTQPHGLRCWLARMALRRLERQIPASQLCWSKAGAR